MVGVIEVGYENEHLCVLIVLSLGVGGYKTQYYIEETQEGLLKNFSKIQLNHAMILLVDHSFGVQSRKCGFTTLRNYEKKRKNN